MDAQDRQVDPPLHVALISRTGAVSDIELAWMAAACQRQVRDHFCPIWGLPAIQVAAYRDGATLPARLAAVIYLVDDDGNPASLGYHGEIGGLVYGFVDVGQTLRRARSLSVVVSHELLELILNRHLDRWIWVESLGLWLWREACDPVEDLTYWLDVELIGIKRRIMVSDFVRPEFFDATAAGWGDYLNRVRPLDFQQGYQVGKDQRGSIVSLPVDSAHAAERIAIKQAAQLSRLSRAA